MTSREPSSTVQRQQQALVSTIKELEQREHKRLNRLAIAKTKAEQQALHEQFDRERQVDKERVDHLMKDYFAVEQQAKNDSMLSFFEQRQTLKKTQTNSQRDNVHLPNRFEGIETHLDMIFHADVTKRFEKHDKRFQAKLNHTPYDPVKEERKLRLLSQKRDLLQNLIKLQSATDGQPTYTNNVRRASDTYSLASGSSSGASYATFASSRVGNRSMPSTSLCARNRTVSVPKLQLK